MIFRFSRLTSTTTLIFFLSLPMCYLQAAEGYKLGMFSIESRQFTGLVIDDNLVVDLSGYKDNYSGTLQDLISKWDQSVATELLELSQKAKNTSPAYAYPLSQVKILPPISDPDSILMAARNYTEHAEEMAAVGRTSGTTSVIDESITIGIPGLWSRDTEDRRPNPYLFPKLKSSLIAYGEPIILPPGRTNIDFECELVAVIGKTASRVPVDDALEYVFGYMPMVDVSDREDRPDGRYGSDWLMGKSHDSFGPSGPFIVPAEFIQDPQDLKINYWLNDTPMQDSSSELMIHTVRDLVSYASYIATLRPGDLIGTGTPGGVGEGRTPPVYLQDGDESICQIEAIGTIRNPVKAAAEHM